MRIPNSEYVPQDWRIGECTRDFHLEDVWALPTPGQEGDFAQLVKLIAASDPAEGSSAIARTLWATRWKLGKWFGWDVPGSGLGSRVATLRERLPADLRDAQLGPEFAALPFRSVYLLENEWAAEVANATMHAVMHVSWVPDRATGGYRGQMAILVKPNGLPGRTYMAAIRPFRHLLVYPSIMRQIDHDWRRRRAPAAGL